MLLPFWATVTESYRLAWRHRAEFVRIAWCWLLIAALIAFAYTFYFWSETGALLCIFHSIPLPLSLSTILISTVFSLIIISCGVSVAVAWHRLVLRGEQVKTPCYLRFDGVVRNYLLLAIFIFLLKQLPTLGMLLARGGQMTANFVYELIAVILMIAILPYAVRLQVMLPARALAVPGITIKEVLRRTRWNFWRIFGGLFFCGVPGLLFLPFVLLTRVFCGDGIGGPLIYTGYIVFVTALIAPIYLSFLSLAFRHFFEKDAKG